MNIVIMGPKGAGKSAVGCALAERLGWTALETDAQVEALYEEREGTKRTCREIFTEHGEAYFRQLEVDAVAEVVQHDWRLLITGGSTMLNPASRRLLRNDAILIYLSGDPEVLWERATAKGIPPWLTGPEGKTRYTERCTMIEDVLLPYADIVLDTASDTPDGLAVQLEDALREELSVRSRAANTYGEIIRVATFGESHGPAIGAVLDGMQPGIPISEESIQHELDRRRPGQSKLVTRRKESDTVHILSGVFEGKSTGAPIALVIYNQDQKSESYSNIKDLFRPGHADFSFYRKYGIRDYRGGGRSSGRETACRVAAGAIARQVLANYGVKIVAHTVAIGDIEADTCDFDVIESNPVRCADPIAAEKMADAILQARKDQDSIGGIIRLEVLGLPVGLGDPVFGKLDARLCSAIMTVGAVKGIEIGGGFALAKLRGSASNDNMRDGGFLSNNAGGIIGGISNGQPLVMQLVVKPTSSIAQPQQTIDIHGDNVTCEVYGRHDPCIVPRAVPVVENMAALTLLDCWEIQSRLNPDWAKQWTQS